MGAAKAGPIGLVGDGCRTSAADGDDPVPFDFVPSRGFGDDDAGGDGGDDDDDDVGLLYARHHEAILRFFRTKVPSNAVADAEELASTVFLRLAEKRKRGLLVDKHGRRYLSKRGLLYGMAFNVLKEHIRGEARRNKIEDISHLSIEAMGRSLSSQASLGEKLALVHEGLRCLRFYEQLVIECCTYHNMSFKDTATLLDIPLGSVATHSRRGRQRLGEWLMKKLDDRADPRPSLQEYAVYPWYAPPTGHIDHHTLLACAMNDRPKSLPAELPAWFVALELPSALPDADPGELSNLIHSIWQAWDAAGRPPR
jgi:RNA polymerase sigma factor (sigma-70 family)